MRKSAMILRIIGRLTRHLQWGGLGVAVVDGVADDVPVLVLAVEENVPAEDVDTPEGPKIAPGPNSGLSISSVWV